MAMGLVRPGKRQRGSRRAPMAEINVTPFVDVMLVLLIIFMVTAPLLNTGVPVDLPDSRANALPEEAEPVELTIDGAGTIYLGEDALAPGELPERLADIRTGVEGELPQVTLRASRSIDYGRVMAVMGELNRAGFNQIAMVTNSTSAPPASIAGSDEGQ
ncbi:ExbD/TolR family protein [Parerythrobacter lacustris]|uniref:ExbD/TolR family protein n=1 Tax=Parerythrobacter lacustris TaxID=2969984 RepID=A0ABT1XN66_9SPHN|nr:ExbD/TolR family protein [Parerythrobacter lacustris]MCR2833007.1 ExbD/TolR family protein [Parerythrobacter lacustris]